MYYGHFTRNDCAEMTRFELDWFHSKLIKTKEKEKEEHEKAMAQVRQANANNRAHSGLKSSSRVRRSRPKRRR